MLAGFLLALCPSRRRGQAATLVISSQVQILPVSPNAPVAQRSERSPYKRDIIVRVNAGVPKLPRGRIGRVNRL